MLVDSASPIASALLDWYDAHHRSLPWRRPPGSAPPDPYAVWLSEIMLQQTTVAAVRPRFAAFLARWPTVAALAAADESEVMSQWAGLGYYARARNLIACARAVAARGGFPEDEAGLRALPGIGDYTAAAIAAIAFGRHAVAVDANVERVVARLFAVETPLPAARRALRALAATIVPPARAGDFAQAMMDLGSAICTSRAPACLACPLAPFCEGRASGAPERFPRKPVKAIKPVRHGAIFWLERDGEVLLDQRPANGLLGGMRALPTGPWTDAPLGLTGAPVAAEWRRVGQGRHVFTHFALDYSVEMARTEDDIPGEWWPIASLAEAGLPTLFVRAAERAIADRAVALPSNADARLIDILLAKVVRGVAAGQRWPFVLGLCGAQGSGKSTLADALAGRLTGAGTSTAILSLDDLYKTKAERVAMAAQVHPLFRTRGVPGTHDVPLGESVLAALRAGGPAMLPRFDKAVDDRADPVRWRVAPAGTQVLILEGWCVGARPQPDTALAEPVNRLEREEDADGRWRRFSNAALADYARLFSAIDLLVFLAAPSFDVVRGWRIEQEQALRRVSGGGMSDAEVGRFVEHYERLTRHILEDMPGHADVIVRLGQRREILSISDGDRSDRPPSP